MDFFARSPALICPVIALGLFMTIFVTTSLRALRADRARIDRLARMPLSNDEEIDHG
jgi:hypothetical protein